MLREIGSRRALHQGWKWAFKSGLSVELSEPLSVNEVFLMLLVFCFMVYLFQNCFHYLTQVRWDLWSAWAGCGL